MDMLTEEQEREIARIDAGGNAFENSEPIEEPLQFKQPLGLVLSLRLTAAQWQTLYAEARELGLGPTALARMWVLEKLRKLHRDRLAESGPALEAGGVSTPAGRSEAADAERRQEDVAVAPVQGERPPE